MPEHVALTTFLAGQVLQPTKGPIQRFLKNSQLITASADRAADRGQRCSLLPMGFARWLAAKPNSGSHGALTIILGTIDGRLPEKPFLSFSKVWHLKRQVGRPDKFP